MDKNIKTGGLGGGHFEINPPLEYPHPFHLAAFVDYISMGSSF